MGSGIKSVVWWPTLYDTPEHDKLTFLSVTDTYTNLHPRPGQALRPLWPWLDQYLCYFTSNKPFRHDCCCRRLGAASYRVHRLVWIGTSESRWSPVRTRGATELKWQRVQSGRWNQGPSKPAIVLIVYSIIYSVILHVDGIAWPNKIMFPRPWHHRNKFLIQVLALVCSATVSCTATNFHAWLTWKLSHNFLHKLYSSHLNL